MRSPAQHTWWKCACQAEAAASIQPVSWKYAGWVQIKKMKKRSKGVQRGWPSPVNDVESSRGWGPLRRALWTIEGLCPLPWGMVLQGSIEF